MGIFDEMAARYETPERAAVADSIAETLRASLEGSTQKSAMDYGCGTGLVGLQLAACFQSLLMVDASPNMVEVVQSKINAAHMENVRALCADFSTAVPRGLCPDIIFMTQVLLHIPDTEAMLRRLCGVLNSGGRLLVVDFDRDESIVHEKVHGGFVQEELVALVKESGFAKAAAQTFYHGKNIFMNKDASMFILEAEKAPV